MRDVLDTEAVRRWCRLTADALGDARGDIDALNVFPVPDGDTGTNLHLTVLAAADAVERLPEGADAEETWRALAQGALLGARGNSGVILSQVFRGFAEVLGDHRKADGAGLGEALRRASSLAHLAVARPVEGTVLTVLRAACEAPADRGNLGSVARSAADGARAALERTPEQLEILSRNGVVDAGGAGLCVVLDVLAAVVNDEEPGAARSWTTRSDRARPGAEQRAGGRGTGRGTGRDTGRLTGRERAGEAGAGPRRGPEGPDEAADEHGRNGPDYEVMYLLEAAEDGIPSLRAALDSLGDSLVVVGGDGLWNVHVHVDDAGAAIEAGMAAGRPHRIRVTYLPSAGGRVPRRQGRNVVAVVAGEMLAGLAEAYGVRTVRREPGGDLSLPVLLEAILEAGDQIVVLLDGTDVRPVAEAAARSAGQHGVRVAVVASKAPAPLLAAMSAHDPARGFDEDVREMSRAAEATRYGHVDVTAGAAEGHVDGDAAVTGGDAGRVAVEVVDRMLDTGEELVTLIAADGAPPELTAAVEDHLKRTRPDVEVEVYQGGDQRHTLLIGVEPEAVERDAVE